MSILPDPAQIEERVREILTDALSLRPDQVRPESRLIEDLGAESIDLLDLRFRIEKTFGFRISTQDLAEAFGTGIAPEEFRRRFTVAALCDYVRMRLEQARG